MLENISKRYKNILFVFFAAAVIGIAALIAVYADDDTMGTGNNHAFSLSSEDLSVVDCNFDGESGVSEGKALEITFNQPIPVNASDIVTISPEIKGVWSVVDSRLIFTPDNRWATGTYYTVTLNGNSNIRYLGRALKEDAVFSFETQDSALRIPATATFRMDQRQYFFHPKEKIVLDAAYTDNTGKNDISATVKVWKFDNDKSFIRKFSPLFSIPSWATVTKNKTLLDTGGLDYLGKTEVTLDEGGITYPALEEGKYLLRVVVGGAAIDVAVTVDSMDVYSCFDGNNIELWCHENGAVLQGAKIRVGTNVEYLDDLGCGKFSYDYTIGELWANTSLRALEIVSEKTNHIIFMDDTMLAAPSYQGNLVVGKTTLDKGDTLSFYGNLTPKGTAAVFPHEAEICLMNASGIVKEITVDVKNDHSFGGEFEDLALPCGEYSLVLKVNNKTITETSFYSQTQTASWGSLRVSQEETVVQNGNTLVFRVQALNKSGKPLKALAITSSDGITVMTDGNGEALFYINAAENKTLGNVTKTVTFQGVLVGQGTLSATAQYIVAPSLSVNSLSMNKIAPTEVTTTIDNDNTAEMRYFISDGESFRITAEASEDASFVVRYQDGKYYATKEKKDISLSLPQEISAAAGDTLSLTASADGNCYYIAELYEGNLPFALADREVKNEEASVSMWRSPVAAMGCTDGSISFDTQGLYGDYFLRVRGESLGGTAVSRYIPVSITNGGTLFASMAEWHLKDSAVTIPFHAEGSDLGYQISVDNKTVATGEAEADNVVDIGTWSVGSHTATVSLWSGDTLVKEETLSFSIYEKEPSFMTATTKASEEALLGYTVKGGNEKYVQKLFSLNLFPGNHLMQVLGRDVFYGALKENSSFLATYINGDFSTYQNADGSFSRVVGGAGDVLLSCFVAGNENAVFDRQSLKSFFRKKMMNTTDSEVLALSYWGLSLLGEAPLEEMTYHINDKSFSANAKLYLAEAFYSNGDKTTAKKVFSTVVKSLKKSEEKYFYKDPEKNQSIFTASLTLNLSLKLDTKYTEGLVAYLMGAKLETQSNRYLMTLNLVDYLNMSDIALTEDLEKADVRIVAKKSEISTEIEGAFKVNGKETEAASVRDMVELSLDWSSNAKKNTLYMVYFTPNQEISLVEDENTFFDHGHVMKLTMDTETSLFFSGEAMGEDIAGEVTILNMTSGKVLAKANLKGLVVTE